MDNTILGTIRLNIWDNPNHRYAKGFKIDGIVMQMMMDMMARIFWLKRTKINVKARPASLHFFLAIFIFILYQ